MTGRVYELSVTTDYTPPATTGRVYDFGVQAAMVPTVEAGLDKLNVEPGEQVRFTATSPNGPDTYTWRQVSGPTATFTQATSQAIGYIGDSLTAQNGHGETDIYNDLTSRGWAPGSRVDGLVGRSIIDGVEPYIPSTQTVINTWRADGFDPDVWCIALGTNDQWRTDADWTTRINTVLDLLVSTGTGKTVYWVGISFRPDMNDTRSTRFIAVLRAVAAARTDCTVIPIDYNALIHDGRDETGLWLDAATDPNGIHMTNPGYTARNGVIDKAIGSVTPPGGVTVTAPYTVDGGTVIMGVTCTKNGLTSAEDTVQVGVMYATRLVSTPDGWKPLQVLAVTP